MSIKKLRRVIPIAGGAFRVGESFLFAAQIPDDKIGRSGSRCSNCGESTAYCEQICRHCGLPFIGPVGLPQWPKWNRMSTDQKMVLAEKVFAFYEGSGRLSYANVKPVPLTPDELNNIEKLEDEDVRLFYLVHGVHPREIRTVLR